MRPALRCLLLLLTSSSTVGSSEHRPIVAPVFDDGIADGIVAEEAIEQEILRSADLDEEYQERIRPVEQRCCTEADPAHLLLVSTMDGVVHALDVNNGGTKVWKSNLDAGPLLGGNLAKMQPLIADGEPVYLVPALDGSLFMFSQEHQLLEPIPLSTEMLLQSVRVGEEAVAGGKTISTTGVDPNTGKIRYHCSAVHCEQGEAGQPYSTLVFRRTSHAIRAVDALTGSEKWNLSVSEYDASIVVRPLAGVPEGIKRDIRFVISPPKGVITALDSCGQTLWTTALGVHIARSWHLTGSELKEVSLFDSNIHSQTQLLEATPPSRNAVARSESLFYLGTINSDPFILYSEKVRREMHRLAKQVEYIEQQPEPSSIQPGRPSNALVKYTENSYKVAKGTLDDILSRTFKHSFAQQKGSGKHGEERYRREIGGPTAEIRVALPATSEEHTDQSCANDGTLLVIGEDHIKNAGNENDMDGDQGWFVMRPVTRRRTLAGLLGQAPGTCTAFMKRSLRLEDHVNPLWRLLAIFLSILTGIIGTAKYLRKRQKCRIAEELAQVGSATPSTHSQAERTPLTEQECQTSHVAQNLVAVPATDASEECVKKSFSVEDSPPERRARNTSTRSSSGVVADFQTFQSKFLADFEPLRVLGRGGFGVVFKARNKLDECPYAVKRISVSNSEKAIERVLREVRAMAKLDHVGIIRYYHTWIERPPEGWQRAMDKEILGRIRHQSSVEEGMQDVLQVKRVSSEHIEKSSSLHAAVPSGVDPSDDGSWLDDEGVERSTEQSSSDDLASSSSSSADQILPMKTQDGSESIIFEHDSKKRSRSSEYSKLGTDLALVTSVDEELLPSKSTTNSVFLYIQMQLCMDRTLFAWLSANKEMDSREPSRMKAWMRQMTTAVAYIHEQDLIHRDIKPQNIFFISADSLKIGDLGLVTKCGVEETAAGGRLDRTNSGASLHTDNVGTRGYMSPEQLANLPYTAKVDVFSLGLIFTEFCIPFQTLMERSKVLAGLQQGKQPEELADRPAEREFVAWLTQPNPADRPTCEEILKSPFLSE